MKNWFYKSFLGGLYIEFLLWVDRIRPRKKYFTPKEIAQVIRESSQTIEGVKKIKKLVNGTVNNNLGIKLDTHTVLTRVDDLILLAEKDHNSTTEAVEFIKDNMDFSNKDIKTDTDHAKMVMKRIKDYEELHSHQAKRNALREARKQKNVR